MSNDVMLTLLEIKTNIGVPLRYTARRNKSTNFGSIPKEKGAFGATECLVGRTESQLRALM